MLLDAIIYYINLHFIVYFDRKKVTIMEVSQANVNKSALPKTTITVYSKAVDDLDTEHRY